MVFHDNDSSWMALNLGSGILGKEICNQYIILKVVNRLRVVKLYVDLRFPLIVSVEKYISI